MADITLISGSTLGGAEYVAEHLAEKLEEGGSPPKRCTVRCWKIYLPRGSGLIISSTHGAGDIPDNLSPLMKHCRNRSPIFLRSASWHNRYW
ncbi:flavodoxin domain-containing protein [Escherichia coli]